MPRRLYSYAGPEDIRAQAVGRSERFHIVNLADLRRCLARLEPVPARRAYVPATYIVDPQKQLWLADRRSEHVACAGTGDVLAAGELVFAEDRGLMEVIEASNQSTGYCPEPECWSVVAAVLDRLQIPHPGRFTTAFEFRRCDSCGAINLIKDGIFECAVCQAELSAAWNFEAPTKATGAKQIQVPPITLEDMTAARRRVEAEEAAKRTPLKVFTPFQSQDLP